MDERDRQLERLRTLRDSGALTDGEYELEVAKLTPTAPPPLTPPPSAEPLPPLPPSPAPVARRFNPLLVIAPLAAVAIAVLVYFLVAGRGQQSTTVAANEAQANKAAPANAAAAPKAPTMRDRPEAEQLATAFRAVFGRDGPVPRDLGGPGGTERAARLLWTSFGPVLLTESSQPDGCHACAGYVGAYYLRDTGTGFEVASRHPEAAPGAGWGNAPEDWRVVDTYTTYPALYYEGGYTGQGSTSLFAHLVELRPQGPADSTIDLGFDNSGAVGDQDEASSYEGAIRNIVKNQGFEVVYTGSCEFTRRYVRRGETFQPETDIVPECAN